MPANPAARPAGASCVEADEKGFPRAGLLDPLDSQVDAASGTIRCRAMLPNRDGTLLPGMFARVRLATSAPHPALPVPETAVGSDQGKKFVFIVNDQNVAERRTVQIGQLEDAMRVVSEGLTPSDLVITSELQRVREGAVVEPQRGGSPSPAAPLEAKPGPAGQK